MASSASQGDFPSFLLRGGEFLLTQEEATRVFIPEDFSEEQRMMAATGRDFIRQEVLTRLQEVEAGPDLAPILLDKAAELGFLGVSVPTEYGGLGMDFLHSLLMVEALGVQASFSTTYGAHTGIGTLPIVYYGTAAQKKKYLADIVSAKKKICYCLTEPEAGSDANAGKTTATPADGKHYLLNGQKMWISNAGFADIFIVFAKVEHDKDLSAFIVERDFGGITMGQEEKKMGLHGSSTRQVFFNDTKVPVGNMLAARGMGFKIALNILNAGRIKLAAFVLSGTKHAITTSIAYAHQRRQFGKPIASFGAIQQKIAEMIYKTYACESATYRVGSTISRAINFYKERGLPDGEAKLKGTEEYAIECAMMKVYASEVMSLVADHAVQIHGGMGFSEDLSVAAAYRDARVTRIYEGSNEINRMLVVGMLVKRAVRGTLPFMQHVEEASKALMAPPATGQEILEDFAYAEDLLGRLKTFLLLLAGKMVSQYGDKLQLQQELLLAMADIVIEIYVSESTLLRLKKANAKQAALIDPVALDAILQLCLVHAVQVTQRAGSDIISFLRLPAEEENIFRMASRRYTKQRPQDVIRLGRKISAFAMDKKVYPFVTY